MSFLLSNRYGASILVSAVSLPQTFQRLRYNHHCFLVLETNSTLPPPLWEHVRQKDVKRKKEGWNDIIVVASDI